MHNRAALLLNFLAGNVVSRYRHRCLGIDPDASDQILPSYGLVKSEFFSAMQHLPIIRANLIRQSRKLRR